MRSLYEFLSINAKESIIHATDDTIRQIVKDELDRLGLGANLNHIDVSKVTDMSTNYYKKWHWGLFSVENKSNEEGFYGDVSEWDVSSVKDMKFMFHNCDKFNCDISGWNLEQCENTSDMFRGCSNFCQDLSSWNVKNVKTHDDMFYECPKMKDDMMPQFNFSFRK